MKTESYPRHWLLLDQPALSAPIDLAAVSGGRFYRPQRRNKHLSCAEVWNLQKHGKSASERRRWI